MASRYAPIEDYGIIGDLHTLALVGKDGSIDFLCLPSFDSPSVFAALLDAEGGGHFQIAPQLGEAARKQLYLPDTNVLVTRFLPNAVLAIAGPEDERSAAAVPLLRDRPQVDRRATAYVCRRFACRLPVTRPADLAAELVEAAR